MGKVALPQVPHPEGVAATGAPISGGQVQIKGSNGATVEDTTESDGSYSADVSSLREPYLVRVIAPSGEKYISVASQSALAQGKKINVTPLTHTIVANVFASANADEIFSNFETKAQDFSEAKLEDEKHELLQKFVDAGLLGDGKIAAANIDLLNGNLQAGTSVGVDGLLDVIQVNTDGTNGIEIKLKGAASTLIVDKVNAPDAAVIPVSGSELVAAQAQLSIIDVLRARMNALAALHSSKVVCNGAPVDTQDNASPCDLDNLYSAFLPFFHPNFQEEGNNRDAGIWSWLCDDDSATSKGTCTELHFDAVALKDLTLIHYDDTTKVALISFNVYLNGVLRGMEEMLLKKDAADNNLFKLLGNKKTFKYWIDTESLVKNDYSKTSGSGTASYSVNLNFWYKDDAAYTFSNGTTFTLTSTKQIFPNSSTQMSLYLVTGPKFDENGQCSSGLVFSTTATPYKVFDPANGTETNANYATACANNDACNCQPGNNKFAYFDHENARKVTLTGAQVAMMDRIEKISLSGSGVSGDIFTIKKPLLLNEFNAPMYAPRLSVSVADFCANQDAAHSWNLAVGAGYLNHVSIHYGLQASNMSWRNANDSMNYRNDVKTAVFTPNISVSNGEVVKSSHLYLSSRDDFERQFVRQISCNQ